MMYYRRAILLSNAIPPKREDELLIQGPTNVSAETCNYTATFNGVKTTPGSWEITSGNTYAEISQSGVLTINSSAKNSNVTIKTLYNGLPATLDVKLTYKSGTNSQTETTTTIDENGNATTVATTVTQNSDGTTSTEKSTVLYNKWGYPVEKENENTDTEGNVSTQEIEYDQNGNEVVTGYSIDTSNGTDGSKTFNKDGVNTDYYAFDLTHGFICNINFLIDFTKQPTGQNENHHNILTMKRANPSPWYGFQLRHSNTNKSIILGTQFSTGSNTNTTISGNTTSTENLYEYNLRITYSPSASTNKFVCRNMLTNKNVYTSNLTFPDIDELKYLKVTIGYALDPNGNPYRYSNIDIINFDITRT